MIIFEYRMSMNDCINIYSINILGCKRKDTVSEWLRRSIRNRLGLSRVGSSPASVEDFYLLLLFSNEIYYFLYATILAIALYPQNENYIII